ncbi:MAG: ATP-binding protein, partial [Phycisphaerales bacterium]
FGICPDKTVCGVNGNLDKAQMSLSQHINQRFDPPITPSIKTLEYEQNIIIVLEAKRSKEIPYHEYDGRAFIRVGSETRQLSFKEKQYYSKIRCRDNHQGPWICNKCGTKVMRLESYIIDKDGNFEKSYKCSDCGGEFLPHT